LDGHEGVASDLARQVAEALSCAFDDAGSDDDTDVAAFM
jgi:hypothetical protein